MKIKMFTKTLFTLAFALCLVKPLTADAAVIAEDYPYTYEKLFASEDVGGWDYIFDTARYAAENPDVVAVLGNDPAVLFNHYITTGHLEGRKGYALSENYIDLYGNRAIEPTAAGTSCLRTLEFIDTHITEDMTQLQKFQIIWDYLLDRNNRTDMAAGCGQDDSTVLLDVCLDAVGIECKSKGKPGCFSTQMQVWLDGIPYDIHVAWADE